MKRLKPKKWTKYSLVLLLLGLLLVGPSYLQKNTLPPADNVNAKAKNHQITLSEIPEYNNRPYITINNNRPNFSEGELTSRSFERYHALDWLGRCQVAVANLGPETLPKQDRESISSVTPSGWHNAKYPNVEGKYLYNRCHLIGYQLSGENANKRNLITGTRYFNVNGMLPFENKVADYIKATNNHVLYRVTPLYRGMDLVAKGVLMEAESCEDKGKGLRYSVFVYNVQPGIKINYVTGKSQLVDASKHAPATAFG